jgi:hypothetical protein
LHKLGLVDTGAGIDRSNVAKRDDGLVMLLPEDPDASARRIRDGIRSLTGRRVAVIGSDSLGSPSREGAVGAAIGLAGIRHLEEPSEQDLFGNPSAPLIDRVDEITSAASILMGQSAAARPVVVGCGVPTPWTRTPRSAGCCSRCRSPTWTMTSRIFSGQATCERQVNRMSPMTPIARLGKSASAPLSAFTATAGQTGDLPVASTAAGLQRTTGWPSAPCRPGPRATRIPRRSVGLC